MNTTRKRLEGIARRLSALRVLQQRRQPARPVVVRLDGIAPADRARRHDPAPLCVVDGDPAKIATRRALVAAWSQRSGRTAPFLVILDR